MSVASVGVRIALFRLRRRFCAPDAILSQNGGFGAQGPEFECRLATNEILYFPFAIDFNTAIARLRVALSESGASRENSPTFRLSPVLSVAFGFRGRFHHRVTSAAIALM